MIIPWLGQRHVGEKAIAFGIFASSFGSESGIPCVTQVSVQCNCNLSVWLWTLSCLYVSNSPVRANTAVETLHPQVQFTCVMPRWIDQRSSQCSPPQNLSRLRNCCGVCGEQCWFVSVCVLKCFTVYVCCVGFVHLQHQEVEIRSYHSLLDSQQR